MGLEETRIPARILSQRIPARTIDRGFLPRLDPGSALWIQRPGPGSMVPWYFEIRDEAGR